MEIGDHCLDKSELESRCNQDLSCRHQIVLSRLLKVVDDCFQSGLQTYGVHFVVRLPLMHHEVLWMDVFEVLHPSKFLADVIQTLQRSDTGRSSGYKPCSLWAMDFKSIDILE